MRYRPRRRARFATAAGVALAVAGALLPAAQVSAAPVVPAPEQVPADTAPAAGTAPTAVPAAQRAGTLGAEYRASDDRAVTTSGDADGFHVLVADKKDGYAWKTAATLFEAGFDADAWIGNLCTTESGRYAAVAYAPRTFTNKPELMSRGAFTAVVDLERGTVRKLPVQATLGYFSPGCGTGDQAVFSQFTDEVTSERSQTRLITADAPTGKLARNTVAGQVTSAVPVDGGVVAARGHQVVRITGSRVRTLARTHAVPFQLKADKDGGVTFIDRLPGGAKKSSGDDRAGVFRVADATTASAKQADLLAEGALTGFDLARSAEGEVFVTGRAATKRGVRLPAAVRNPGGIEKDAAVSTGGEAVIVAAKAADDARAAARDEGRRSRASVDLTVLGTGRTVAMNAISERRVGAPDAAARAAVTPSPALAAARAAVTPSPALAAARSAGAEARTATLASSSSPVEEDRACSVPRGDPKKQAYQPTPRQIEWAVSQVIVNGLNALASRPADWKHMGMPAYAPQTLFPLSPLSGGSGTEWRIPPQILLGITAQESNMWQATRYAVPGVTANPLIGNYYGVSYSSDGTQGDPWSIDWSEADCGYGVTQVTDGMRRAGTGYATLTQTQQEAVALDYAANIAAGADILADKWNQTRADGLIVNNGEPKWIENWFYALWAYNSGYYPQAQSGEYSGKWGVGWTNNPANPLWKENRTPFLEGPDGNDDYEHASHPQDWPYQEKVIGWAARPISALFAPGDVQPGYRQATWLQTVYRTQAKPPIDLFCDDTNNCDPSKIGTGATNDTGGGPCMLPGTSTDPLYLKCWYHEPVKWKECGPALRACGYPLRRFDSTYPEQPDGTAYPPACWGGLPSNAKIVDDLPNLTQPAGAGRSGSSCSIVGSEGRFSFDFDQPSGHIDLHQIGAGFQNHFWFSHTYQQDDAEAPPTKVTGTWSLDTGDRGWMRVWVHMPDHGAQTRQPWYVIHNSDSTSPRRTKPQRTGYNAWLSLGAFNFTGTPQVSLSNITQDGYGLEDIAWDALAFEPLPGKPANQVVAMGDSYASGEGVTEGPGGLDYYPESDFYDGHEYSKNSCHRSKAAWSRQAELPGYDTSIGAMADGHSTAMDFQFVACSGARHYDVIAEDRLPAIGQLKEPGQIEQGYLDQHTTLVTIAIGGNDMRFADVVASCVIPLVDCRTHTIAEKNPDTGGETGGETPQLSLWAPAYAHDVVRPRLATTLKKIHEHAPNARIVLMGYPHLLTYGPDAGEETCATGISGPEADWLNELADMLAREMAGAVADANEQYGADAVFSDPRDEFMGKGICGDPDAIHGIILTGHSEADNHPNSMKSFHPNMLGGRLYADSLESTLNSLS
ncbi:SGNH/GDSL hydrolase family protein [Streptomyces sp. 130]|uniref:SGNH/GDSL hydrolase family protein n=1 Tax=Streptomyces sp. 130 TaxID=2591006 RepID=UPI0028C3E462|nr:SGNH/GDSL hydrolase family protein [Streptomyces sp. 130]